MANAAWVKANVQYAAVLDDIRPLKKHMEELQKPMAASQVRIAQCEEDFRKVDFTVATLKEDFGKRTGEVESLKICLHKAASRVAAAKALLSKLGREQAELWQSHELLYLLRGTDEVIGKRL